MEMKIRNFTGLINMFVQIQVTVQTVSSKIFRTRDRAYSFITDSKVINTDFLQLPSITDYYKLSFTVVNLEFVHDHPRWYIFNTALHCEEDETSKLNKSQKVYYKARWN